MKREHQNLLMLAVGDELTAAQQMEFDLLLSTDAGVRAEWESLQRTRQLLSNATSSEFDPFFTTRVMARVDQRRESLADGLVRLFRPLVPAAVAVAVLLGVLNWRSGDLMGEEASAWEVAFGMPAVSVEAAELLDL